MEHPDLWGPPDDYSIFLPNDDLTLFGNGLLGVDFDFDQFLLPPTQDTFNPAVDSTPARSDFDIISPTLPNTATTYATGTGSNADSIDYPELCITPLQTISDGQQSDPVEDKPEDSPRCHSEDELEDNLSISLKRKIEDAIIIFSANADTMVVPKRRKAYSKSRKREVARNRMVGACIPCKVRKGPCDSGIPCAYCLRKVGSLLLAQELCARQCLVATRFDHLDLFQVAKHDHKVRELKQWPIEGERRNIFIGYTPLNSATLSAAFIKVPIVNYNDPNHPATFCFVLFDYYSHSHTYYPNRSYCIAWDSLPSTERLIRAHEASLNSSFRGTGPFKGVQRAVRRFGECYCKCVTVVPLQQLLRKVLRIQSLFGIYQNTFIIKSNLEDKMVEYSTIAIDRQVRYLISKEIVRLEIEILSEIDRRALSTEGIGRQHPIAFWVCLWILILSYKDHRTWLYVIASHDEQQCYELTKHIYNNLTSLYGALYKTTSPLTLDWRTEEVSELLGHDSELIRLFCDIKTEMYWFHAEKDRLFDVDELFKTLVVENENKLLSAHRKAAKKLGIL